MLSRVAEQLRCLGAFDLFVGEQNIARGSYGFDLAVGDAYHLPSGWIDHDKSNRIQASTFRWKRRERITADAKHPAHKGSMLKGRGARHVALSFGSARATPWC
ncbi:MAG: hypothetical protein ABI605_14645 [Rhizobacter sp.]